MSRRNLQVAKRLRDVTEPAPTETARNEPGYRQWALLHEPAPVSYKLLCRSLAPASVLLATSVVVMDHDNTGIPVNRDRLPVFDSHCSIADT